MSRIKNPNDVMVGLVLIGLSVFALVLAWPLKPGTLDAMGPGFFPRALAFLEIGFGLAIVAQGLTRVGEPFERWFPRQIFFVLASIGFFAATIDRLGAVVAIAGTVLVSCLARRETRIIEAVLVAAGMAAFVVLVFRVGLGLPLRVWPWGNVY
ncbi:tripartite tricarboxylate transporter TctB family protein [Starkeya koreensis]|uniref:Tripartite tricarboxylate transporter TctB family protein n=1 Tax=Ancylobacter koreensis TaxID=266121 RepID=A0ABT0DRP3_9HYPH|nr:tripartite tricarboxylate transporter TctB family protein [Ancylobacter koreensis]MCK0209953.1 tripartite tricarboxylate transporter TctB family protein [Ancylobacter koreensis]